MANEVNEWQWKSSGTGNTKKNRIKPGVVLIAKLALFILYQLLEKRRKDLIKEKKEKRKYYRKTWKRKEREKKSKDKLARIFSRGESKDTVFGGEDQSLLTKNAI